MSQHSLKKRDRTDSWYSLLVDECKAIVTEAVFTSRWALVEGYWELGKRIRTDSNIKKYKKGSKGFVQRLALSIGLKERTLYYALDAYDKYPKLDKIPEGKNISWNKLITKYLTKKTSNDFIEEKKTVVKCPRCGNIFEPKGNY